MTPQPLRSLSALALLSLAAACAQPAGDQGLYDGDSAGKPLVAVTAKAPKVPGSMALRGSVPMKGTLKNGAPTGAFLTYRGGNIVENATYVNVFWGAYWTSGTGLAERQYQNAYMTAVAPSAEFASVLTQYTGAGGKTIHTASFQGEKLVSGEPGGTSKKIDDSAIGPAIDSWIAAGLVPAPTINTVYQIYFPKGVSITLGTDASCTTFCGYHSTVRTTRGSGGLVRYISMPHPDCSGCQFASTVNDSLSVVSTHEMAELQTDPDVGLATGTGDGVLGWYDDANGEIGDICASDPNGTIKGYAVQSEWSNADKACKVTTSVPTPTPDFTVAVSPASQTVTQGGAASYSITTTASNGFTGAVTFAVSGLASGVTGSITGAVSGSGTATLSLTTTASAATGAKSFTVTATSGSLSHTASGSLTVNAATKPGFSVSVSPASVSVGAGKSVTATVNVTGTGGFSGAVALSASGLPSGVTGVFSPASITGSGSSTLTLTAGAAAAASSSTLTLTGASGADSHAATLGLTVTPAAQPDFSLSVSPASLTVVAGSTGTATVTVGASNGFSSSVSLSSSGAPSGVSVAFDHSTLTGGGTATVTFSVAAGTAAGTGAITLAGDASGLHHTASVAFTVQATKPPPQGGVVFSDDAESGMGQWVLGSDNASAPNWLVEATTASHSGGHRFRSNPASRNYASNASTYMISKAFSLAGYTSSSLSFFYKFSTESQYDYFYVWASGDNGSTWTKLAEGSGTSKGWNGWAPQATLDLSAFAGKSKVRIAFSLQSDYSVTDWGVGLDDVVVTAQ
jgi:hypothetical protein